MSDQNAENAKIFLNLEDSPETMQSMGDEANANANEFTQDEPMMPQRPQAVSTGSGGVASGPAIIGLIAILGGGSIFGMRVVSNHAAIAADAFEIDYSESVIGADFNQRFEASMLNLERSARPMQVPLTYIARDPFNFSELDGIKVVEVEDDDGKSAEDMRIERERIKEQLRIAKLDRERSEAMINAADGYELQSTLQGSNPVARISGEIVRLGGALRYEIVHEDAENETSEFTVESIGGRSVVLVGPDGSRYELQIGLPTQELAPLEPEAPAEPEAEEAPAEEGSFFQGLMEKLNSDTTEDSSDGAESEGGSEAQATETDSEAETVPTVEAGTASETAEAETDTNTESETAADTAEESAAEVPVTDSSAEAGSETGVETADEAAPDTVPTTEGSETEAEAESEADAEVDAGADAESETGSESEAEDTEAGDTAAEETDTEAADSDESPSEEPDAAEDTTDEASEETPEDNTDDDGATGSGDDGSAPTEGGL